MTRFDVSQLGIRNGVMRLKGLRGLRGLRIQSIK